MKIQVTRVLTGIGVVAFGVALLGAGGPAATGASYEIKGRYFETCACTVSCPCASNATLPTEGHCDAVSLVHIDGGAYGGVKLDGLNIAMVLRSPHGQKVKDSFVKGEMDLVTFYLDDKATARQREVMPLLMAALFGSGEIKGSKPPQYAPMSLTVDGDVVKFDIAGGSKLSFEIENIDVGDKSKIGYKKGDIGNRIVLSNTAPFPFVHDVTQGISKTFKYSDFGTSWEYKERNAFFGSVSGSGK